MIMELICTASQSTPQAFLGVSLIGVYFVVIVAAAIYRIQQGDHLRH